MLRGKKEKNIKELINEKYKEIKKSDKKRRQKDKW